MLTFYPSQVYFYVNMEEGCVAAVEPVGFVLREAGVIHMSVDSFKLPSAAAAQAGGDPSTPSGKLYDWQLQARETPEMVALPPQALVQRVFERSASFSSILERTAAFFVVISRNNGYEGRDPLVVTDDVRCGTVSDFLGIELDVLGRALLEMQRRGMVSPCEDGNLRLDDLPAIDRLSSGGQADF